MADVNSNSLQIQDDNLETFSLLWLDTNVNTTEDNRKTQQKLREIINHLKTFDDQQQCYQYIRSFSSQDRLVLIISGRCGRQLVPRIHQLRQVSSIYVYCMDQQGNEQWAKDFTKVKRVIVTLSDLVDHIKADQETRVKVEEPLLIEIFNVKDNPDQSTTGLNGHFVHSLLLIDVLIRMKSIETDKRQLITLCKKAYQYSNTQLALIREFESEYSSERALWWYTRDSFLHRMLNKALRVQNIDLLFLFRFVIKDMYRQLKQYQCQSPVHIYRGQVMSNDELNTLQRSIGKQISINSFFSTSIKRHKALGFLNSCEISNDLYRVLFEIDANPAVVTTKPFADVSSLSDFGNEHEVLFMIGCIFRLVDIRRENKEQVWIIRMTLCGDDECDRKKLFDYMKKSYGGGVREVSLCSFGRLLYKMGKYDLAEKMYNRLLLELPPGDPSLCVLYWSLGSVSKEKGDYDNSLQWFQKSLSIYIQKKEPSNYVSVGGLYNCIGEIYRKKGDDKTALEYYNKAVKLFQEAHDEKHPHMANILNDIAILYHKEGKYTEAMEHYRMSLEIDQKHLPADHPTIALSYNNIGCVYRDLQQYDLAMEHHQQSLKIRLKSLPPEHPEIGRSYENIGSVHGQKHELKEAMDCYQKALTIYRSSLSSEHPHVIRIEKQIQDVSSKLK